MNPLPLRWLSGECDPCDTVRTCPTVFDEGEGSDHVVMIGKKLPRKVRRQLRGRIGRGETAMRMPKPIFQRGASRLIEVEGEQ